jgi:hypothetical protein
VGKIKGNQIVAQQEGGSGGKLIESSQRLRQTAVVKIYGFAGVTPDSGKAIDKPSFFPHFEVNGQTAGSEITTIFLPIKWRIFFLSARSSRMKFGLL